MTDQSASSTAFKIMMGTALKQIQSQPTQVETKF